MAKYKIGTDLYDLPEEKVESFLSKYPDAIEVTDEIQTTPTEGKTNGAAAKGATATPVTGPAPESMESKSDDILSGLEKINDTREVDRRIKIIAGDDMQIDALDSPKRIHQYNALIGRKNKIQKQAASDIEKLPTPDRIIESFDVDEPAIKGESYITDQGGVYIASSPLVVDGEVVGSQAQPVSLEEVEVIAPRLSVEELSEKYNSFTKNIVGDTIDVLALATEILPIETEATKAIKKASEAAKDRREQYNRLYQEGKIDLNATRSAYNTISNSLRTMANLDDQFEYIWYLAGTQGVDEETRQKNLKKLSEARRKLNLKETYYLPTQRFDRLKEKKGVLEYALGGLAGIFDAASSVGTSFAQTPAGLFINIAASNIKENNEINAERLGISVDEYIQSGQADFMVPMVTTALELGSEWLKLGQISKAINRMPIGRQKKIAQTMQVFGGNGAQEMFQYSLNQYNKYSAEGLSAEDATRKSIMDFFSPESFEQGLKGAFGGTAVAVGGQALKASAAIKTPSENNRIQNDINRLYELDKAKYSKNITPEQLKSINTAQAEIKKSLTQQVDANEVLVASLTDKQLETINQNYDLLTSINAEAQATQEATNLTQEQKQAILEGLEAAKKQASQEIYNVRNEGEAFVNELRKAREAVEPLSDVEILDFENTEQVKDFLQKQDQDLDTKASEEQAFVIQNPETGKQTVVINRGVAAKEAIRHEVGHVLLYQTVKDSPETAINLGNALLNELNKIDPAQVKNSNFKKRMEQYADSTRAVQMEEAITLFSDAINTGDIKFNENIFTKLGDRVRRAMQKFGVNIKFDSGRDVYNFVKDYNKSLEKGGLSLAQVQAATKGIEGELITPVTEQQAEQIIKESRTEEQAERNKELMQRAKEGDVLAANDLVQENSGLILRLLKFNPDVAQQSGVTSDDVLQAVTDMATPGMVDFTFPGRKKSLVEEYKESDGEVTTFLGRLRQRQAEIYTAAGLDPNKFTTERIDAPEARQVVAEEVTITETPTKPEAKAIDPFRIMPDVKETATAEVQKSIADKDIDVTTVTYKELKDAAPYQTVADFFNIPVSRITNPKDNLRKSDDVANIQRWILKNEPTLKNLFTEANREVVEVKEGNRVIRKGGEPTAIPRNLLNKFYTKGARVGNNFQWTLKPYDRKTFLEAVGIKDGKVDPNFTPRAAEAQTIKGILDMYTRNLGNVIARETIEAREDIAPAEKARVKAEVAKGKPRLMMAKSLPKAEQNQIAKDNNLTNEELSELLKKPLNQIAEENIDVFNDVNQYMLEDTQAPVDFKNQGFLDMTSEASPELAPFIKRKGHITRRTVDGEYVFDEAAMQDHVDTYSMQLLDFIPAYMGKREADAKVNYKFLNNAILKGSSSRGNAGGALEIRKANQQKFNEKVNQMKPLNETKASLETKKAWKEFEKVQDNLELAESTFTGPETLLRKIQEIQAMNITAKEKVKKAQEIFDPKSLDAAQKLFKAYNLSIQDWVNNQVESGNMTREKAMEYVIRDKQKNTNFNKGERALAAFTSVYFVDGPQKIEKTKGEHVKDSATVSALTTTSIYNNTFGKDALEILNGFEQSYVPKRFADEMDALGGANSQLKNKRFLFNPDIGNQVFDLATGKTMYELELENATQKIIQDLGRLDRSKQKSSVSNNNMLPPVVKFAKKVPNSEVLNRMSELDADAKEANKQLFDSADLDKGFNDILEQTTGIASEKRYKRVKAEVAGAARGKAIRGIPYSAQDFVGLLYETLSKGKLGDAQMAWYKENLLKPYAKAMNEIDAARLSMMQDYRGLKKDLKVVPKDLRKKIPGEPFTREQAVRVYIWNKQGMKVPGISEADLKDLTDYVSSDTELQLFAEQLISMQKGDEYAKPKEGWPAGSITTDLLESINTVKRAKYLEQWKTNKDIIFSEENMNKLEAAYGKKYRVALENMLDRMQSGRNRRFSDDSLTGRFTDWLQGSIGTIMFFNTRSALLQTISAMNFINFTDNNPLAAAKAFGNQKQFWSDFVKLINSDFLKARRSGLRMNVNEADIADMAKKGGPRAVINKLLQLGFAPTQIADSFAIASGGATFYRNRINTYKKQGLSQQEAETKAFEDFRENAEESQQSARPDRISMQQAGPLGRLILAFQNTPSQYARIIDKSVRDLKNRRGDAKTNISKIIYYSTVQNLLFNALQQALFAFAFDDEEKEDEEKEKKYVDIANSMMDSLLRGTGVAGGVMSVLKNAILRIVRESEKARPNYEKVGADLIKIAPPVSSKLSKINQAARSYKWDKEEMKEKGWSLDNPAYLAGANVISALTNVPLDRGIKKANNVVNATDSDLETWERLALLGGWQDWEIGIDEETKTNKPQPRKTTRTKKRKVTKR